jgi:hypothetical protein
MAKKRAKKPKFEPDTSFNFGFNVQSKPRTRRPRGGKSKSNAYFRSMYGS